MEYDQDFDGAEPSAAQLAAIEDEEPVLAAELELLDVQLMLLSGRGPVDAVTAYRLERARAAVVRETCAWYRRRFNARRSAA
ncbi:hypothetical protein Drose_06910 [Dactylosporangium roseum]|uniref:Uncharacterized protein n=1 Tax=Dactylosporangium roseum TaxID=47989 RepID=A0ABY5ZAH3_9ACTN|nr:DUF6284 family protein [Dactylosporangium roseum]UWZ37995.1 hypothetical protein Drose_06910 [Dactylosporangium roseum]